VRKLDRRTFLVNGLRTGVVVVAAGSVAYDEWSVTNSGPGAQRLPGPPHALAVNQISTAVGVDPDDLSFSWVVSDPRRGALQSAYRLVVRRAEPGGGGSTSSARTSAAAWDSGEVLSDRQAYVAYGGPTLDSDTRYTFSVATRDAHGTWSQASEPAPFVTGLRQGDWTASWLRPGPADTGLEKYTYLRKTFDLPSGSLWHAIVYTAAAHKYQLWVNGRKVITGPSFCYPDEQYVQATDVTSALRAGGPNVLGFLHHWYGGGKGRPTSVPGLLSQLSVHYTDGTHLVVGTDAAWVQRQGEWLPAPQRNNDAGDFVEIIDGRESPIGWSEPSYDATGWGPAVVTGAVGTFPFTRMYAQRTSISEFPLPAASVKTLADGAVVVDFGKIYAARPIVEFRDGVWGRTVPMHVGYVLDPDGHVSTTHDTQQTNLAFYYTERDGTQRFDPYTYLGFRYLEIDDPGEPIRRDQVSIMARHNLMPDGPVATFSSSNPTLDAVWELCARSALFTNHEQFVDTPTREKGQFLWDSCSESQVMMRVHGERNMTWQALRDFARSQRRYWTDGRVSDIYPTAYGAQSYVSFTALYPEWVWRYYLSSADEATVVGLYATLQGVANYLWRGVSPTTGLVTGMPLVPSADSNYGYDFDTAADASINILSANAFKRVAQIASLAGDAKGALLWLSRSSSVKAAINRWIRGPDGLYYDGLRSDHTRSANASQLANLEALAYGIVPGSASDLRRVGSYVASLGIAVEPQYGMELLRALHAAGLDSEVIETLTDASRPGWAWILTHGGTFCWEAWVLSDLIGDSMSHGWGSSALVAVQEAILGVTPMAPVPGEPQTVLQVSPAFGLLDTASGIVPTIAGSASLGWSHPGGGGGDGGGSSGGGGGSVGRGPLSFSLTLPPNSLASVVLPAQSPSAVTVDSSPVDRAEGISLVGSGDGTVTLRVAAGTYEMEVSD